MFDTVLSNATLTQNDETILSLTVAFNAVLGQLIKGEPLDDKIGGKLMSLVKSGELPFHAVTSGNLGPPKKGSSGPSRIGCFPSPDALLSPSYMAHAAKDPNIKIEPAWKVSYVYGMPCAAYHILPAAYYLSARFNDDFENGVLHALNGGGQNQIRAMLTGALIGAQVGIDGIPSRFIDGLIEKNVLTSLVNQFTKQFE